MRMVSREISGAGNALPFIDGPIKTPNLAHRIVGEAVHQSIDLTIVDGIAIPLERVEDCVSILQCLQARLERREIVLGHSLLQIWLQYGPGTRGPGPG